MKKTKLVIALCMAIVLSAITLTACYPSNPTKMSKLVGTFQLTSFTRSYTDEKVDDQQVTHDMLAERGIEVYLVVKSDGTGYYIYKDNDHAAGARIVKITYSYDEDDSALVSSIVYNVGIGEYGDGSPMIGREHLGVNFKRRRKQLSYTMPAVFGRKYSQSVVYKQVSSDTTLAYAQKQLGVTLQVAPYEVAGLDGWHYYSYEVDENTPYIYYFMDVHMAAGTADIYYALKEDGVPRELKGQAVTYTLPTEPNDKIEISIAGKTYRAYYNVITVPTSLEMPQEDSWTIYLNSNSRATAFDSEAEIAAIVERYQAYVAEGQGEE